jgi:uncharacterized protein (DUF2147 family)
VIAPLILAAAAAADLSGDWVTADRNALVRIGPCGAQLCGVVVRVLAQGANVPRTDVNNPQASLRSRPLVGIKVLSGFVPAGGGTWVNGHAYDPKTGRSYKASLAPDGKAALTVTGCVWLICKSQRWLRAPKG